MPACRGPEINISLLQGRGKKTPWVNHINYYGETALFGAVEHIHLPMVTLLMNRGANPTILNKKRVSVVELAKDATYNMRTFRRKGDFPQIMIELKQWPHVDSDIRNPATGITNLMIAAVNADADLFKTMIYYSDNLDAQDDLGNTALHYAVAQGRSALKIEDLVDAGAKTDIENNDHKTASDLLEGGIRWMKGERRAVGYMNALQERLDAQ